jgi:hypothetical protein
MKEMALATTGTGEKASNFKTFGEKDIVIGGRAYCSKQGIEYLLGRKSDFLLRFGTKQFGVYNEKGRKGLKPCGIWEKALYNEHEGQYKPPRF